MIACAACSLLKKRSYEQFYCYQFVDIQQHRGVSRFTLPFALFIRESDVFFAFIYTINSSKKMFFIVVVGMVVAVVKNMLKSVKGKSYPVLDNHYTIPALVAAPDHNDTSL